jgi:hypothetical protein
MRPISAVDAVSSAIYRTRDFLFRPFTWGTYLKLGLVAIVTEGLGSDLNGSSHNGHSSGHGPMNLSPFNIQPIQIAAIVAMSLLAIVVSLWLFYLLTRLRFAFFNCLIHNTKQIRPGWRLYREQATRFFWMNIGVGFCFFLVVGLVAIPFVSGFLQMYRETQQGGHPEVGAVLGLLLPLLPIIFLLVVTVVVLDVVMRDWMLPHYALDNATAGEAWSRVWARIMAEKRQFIAYVLLRLILPTLAVIGVFIVLLIPGLIIAGSIAAVEWGIHSAFADASGGSAVTGMLLQVFFGVLAFGFTLLASICIGGPVSTATREYALLFYGGRYQALGDILYPPVARSAV